MQQKNTHTERDTADGTALAHLDGRQLSSRERRWTDVITLTVRVSFAHKHISYGHLIRIYVAHRTTITCKDQRRTQAFNGLDQVEGPMDACWWWRQPWLNRSPTVDATCQTGPPLNGARSDRRLPVEPSRWIVSGADIGSRIAIICIEIWQLRGMALIAADCTRQLWTNNTLVVNPELLLLHRFLSRVSILTRDIDIANLSVRLSVHPSVTFRY